MLERVEFGMVLGNICGACGKVEPNIVWSCCRGGEFARPKSTDQAPGPEDPRGSELVRKERQGYYIPAQDGDRSSTQSLLRSA